MYHNELQSFLKAYFMSKMGWNKMIYWLKRFSFLPCFINCQKNKRGSILNFWLEVEITNLFGFFDIMKPRRKENLYTESMNYISYLTPSLVRLIFLCFQSNILTFIIILTLMVLSDIESPFHNSDGCRYVKSILVCITNIVLKLYLKVSSLKNIHVPCTYKSNFFLTMSC